MSDSFEDVLATIVGMAIVAAAVFLLIFVVRRLYRLARFGSVRTPRRRTRRAGGDATGGGVFFGGGFSGGDGGGCSDGGGGGGGGDGGGGC
ncbi:MAG: hypothetical protein ACRDXX_02815 [Stackebrandtia sp.]